MLYDHEIFLQLLLRVNQIQIMLLPVEEIITRMLFGIF